MRRDDGLRRGLEALLRLELLQLLQIRLEGRALDVLAVLDDPGVLEHVARRAARVRVHGQQRVDEVLGLVGDLAPEVVVELVDAGLDALVELLVVVVVEGRVAAEQDVREHADGPHVDLLAVGLAVQDLRRDVARRAAELVEAPRARELRREPEVAELDRRVVVVRHAQQILGLEVAVHDAQVVAVLDRLEQDQDQVPRLLLAVELLLGDALEELAALDEVHHQIKHRRLVEERVQLHDVRVVQLLQDVHLLEQGRLVVQVQRLLGDALDREPPPAVLVLGHAHDGHRARAQLLAQRVLLVEGHGPRRHVEVVELVVLIVVLLAEHGAGRSGPKAGSPAASGAAAARRWTFPAGR